MAKCNGVGRVVSLVCVLAAVPLLAGCGLMFGGTKQVVRVSSSPDGATITTRPDTADAKTPASLSLERKHEYVLTFSMPGYTSQQVQLRRSMRGGIVFLDILSCCLSVVVDAVTGGWYELSPELVNVSLIKTDENVPGPETITVSLSTKPSKGRGDVRVESTEPGVTVEVQGR